jgi:DMSO/TMAO reductase YedYZ molybdopterin-dependent catalytic subunit
MVDFLRISQTNDHGPPPTPKPRHPTQPPLTFGGATLTLADAIVTRRDLLKLGAAGAVSLTLPRAAWAGAPAIIKPLPPEWFIDYGTNAEMRWDAARDQGYLIEPARFFVRNHTSTPTVDPATWRLRISGDGVRRPLDLSYRALEKLACDGETAFVECAGNGRSFFGTQQGTPASGTQWKLGAIGVAHWRGVRLRHVLERAGLRREAVDVMPAGLDPTYVSGGVDYGHVRRPLPVAKALDDALIALEMNGKALLPDHGFPARLVVPGWVGVANIKWLGSIEVSTSTLTSPFNTTFYPGLTQQNVKSAFELPSARSSPPAGGPCSTAARGQATGRYGTST